MSKQISVVIPTYKRTELLGKCLQALALQDIDTTHFEVIVITDGLDQITTELINQFEIDETISFNCYNLPEKRGPAAARNLGWQKAQGELVVFTDDDCLPSANWLGAYWNAYQKNKKEFIAFTGKIIVPLSAKPTDYERNTAHLENAEFVTANCACTIFALELIGGFDENFTMAWREDSDLEFKLLGNNIIIQHIPGALVTHPVRKARWGVSLNEQKKGMFNALLYKKHRYMYQTKIKTGHAWNYYSIIIFLLLSIICFAFEKNVMALIFLIAWFVLISMFIAKRLSGASKSFSHITEMIITSVCIPFLSVYWTLYGSYKFKVLLL